MCVYLELCLCREEGQEAALKPWCYSPELGSHSEPLWTLWSDPKRTFTALSEGGGGPIFWFVSIMLISPLDISAGHPFLSVCFSESSVLISTSFFAPPPRKHPRVVCAELILPLMSPCVSNFHPDYFEFALIWRVTAVGCLMSSKWGGRKKDIWAEEWDR